MGNNSRHLAQFPIATLFFIVSFLLKSYNSETTADADVDTTDFYHLVTGRHYVDKTLMIEDYLKISAKFPLITRPRGWGKTTNLNMIRKFLEIELDEKGEPLPNEKRANRILFAGGETAENKTLRPLKIAAFKDAMKSHGQHPVVFVSFEEVTGNSYEEIENKLKNVTAKLFAEHAYLSGNLDEQDSRRFNSCVSGTFDEVDLKYSLKFLTDLIGKRFKQHAFVLVDDYDAPTNHLFAHLVRQIVAAGTKTQDEQAIVKAAESQALQRARSLLSGILGPFFNGTTHGLITGVFHIQLENVAHDTHYSLLDKRFSDFYGFTDTDLDELLGEELYVIGRKEVKNWYGYNFAGSVKYNPWSIRHFLANKCRFDNYWILGESGVTSIADEVLSSDSMQVKLQKLLDGEIVKDNINKTVEYNAVTADATVLLFSGFLNVILYGDNTMPGISLPNQEIANILQSKLVTWLCDRLHVRADYFASTAKNLAEFKIEPFKKRLRNLLSAFPANIFPSYGPLFINRIIKCLAYSLGDTYSLDRDGNVSSIIVVCKPDRGFKAVNMEYEITDDVKSLQRKVDIGLQRVVPKNLINIQLHNHVNEILKVSLVFHDKEFRLGYKKYSRKKGK